MTTINVGIKIRINAEDQKLCATSCGFLQVKTSMISCVLFSEELSYKDSAAAFRCPRCRTMTEDE